MSRIPEIGRGDADERQREIGDEIFGSRQEGYGGPSAILLHVPELAERFDRLRNYLVRERALDDRFGQFASLLVARHLQAEYAWYKRVPGCLAAGIPSAVIEQVRIGSRPDIDDEDLNVVYDYVSSLIETRRVSDRLHARAYGLLGVQRMLELVGVVGFYSMLGMICNAFEPELPEGVGPFFSSEQVAEIGRGQATDEVR